METIDTIENLPKVIKALNRVRAKSANRFMTI